MRGLISILLIVSVVLCTFSCTSGNCCSVDTPSTPTSSPVKACCRHCQQDGKTSSQSSERSNSETPDNSPVRHDSDCCSCQGACSGMVRSKLVELKAAPVCVPFSLSADHLLVLGCVSLFLRASIDDLLQRRMNHGLSMRVRVCSLTC